MKVRTSVCAQPAVSAAASGFYQEGFFIPQRPTEPTREMKLSWVYVLVSLRGRKHAVSLLNVCPGTCLSSAASAADETETLRLSPREPKQGHLSAETSDVQRAAR